MENAQNINTNNFFAEIDNPFAEPMGSYALFEHITKELTAADNDYDSCLAIPEAACFMLFLCSRDNLAAFFNMPRIFGMSNNYCSYKDLHNVYSMLNDILPLVETRPSAVSDILFAISDYYETEEETDEIQTTFEFVSTAVKRVLDKKPCIDVFGLIFVLSKLELEGTNDQDPDNIYKYGYEVLYPQLTHLMDKDEALDLIHCGLSIIAAIRAELDTAEYYDVLYLGKMRVLSQVITEYEEQRTLGDCEMFTSIEEVFGENSELSLDDEDDDDDAADLEDYFDDEEDGDEEFEERLLFDGELSDFNDDFDEDEDFGEDGEDHAEFGVLSEAELDIMLDNLDDEYFVDEDDLN